MGARFVILLVVAGGLALYFAVKDPTADTSQPDPALKIYPDDEGVLFWRKDLPGEEPAVPPEFDITVEVDTSTGKNRLYLYISNYLVSQVAEAFNPGRAREWSRWGGTSTRSTTGSSARTLTSTATSWPPGSTRPSTR